MLSAKALTAEVTMEAAKTEEHKKDILRLRSEVNDWKNKYYDCKRKLSQYQYVWSSLAAILPLDSILINVLYSRGIWIYALPVD